MAGHRYSYATILIAALALGAGMTGPARALSPLSCGETYVVQSNDSLSGIALRAYGDFSYEPIYAANRDVVAQPAVLEVGQRLFIPCLDGRESDVLAYAGEQGPLLAASSAGPTDDSTSAADRWPAPDAIRLLARSDFAPFTGRDLPEGGLITELVGRALQRAETRPRFEIGWDPDAGRLLSELLPAGEHDLSFPWFKPDCTAGAGLSALARTLCTDFVFSQAVFGVSVAYYVRRGDPSILDQRLESLHGRWLCRPDGDPSFDLEARGLVEPQVTVIRAESLAACMQMLAAGEVDVVSGEATAAAREIVDQHLGLDVVALPGLRTMQTLHVLARKDDVRGAAYIDQINEGLQQIRDEGVWLEVTRQHLGGRRENS